jgi:hypothetical protein
VSQAAAWLDKAGIGQEILWPCINQHQFHIGGKFQTAMIMDWFKGNFTGKPHI